MKFKIYAPVDYVMGYLRYGHYEGEIEIEDDKINDENYLYELIRDECEFVIDDASIEDKGPISYIEKEVIKDNELD